MLLTEINNHAAELIQHGRYIDAYYKLRSAMELEEMSCRRTVGSAEYCRDGSHSKSCQGGVGVTLSCPLVPAADEIMFSSPLVICSTSDIDDTTECARCTCSAAIYNMGLACHLYMRQNCLSLHMQRRFQGLVQALYQQSLDIGRTLPLSLLHLAISNNLMELTFEQDDWEGASIWNHMFRRLCQLRSMTTGVSDDLWVHFLNVKVYYSENLTTAGAA